MLSTMLFVLWTITSLVKNENNSKNNTFMFKMIFVQP